jgi:hypothetical protein
MNYRIANPNASIKVKSAKLYERKLQKSLARIKNRDYIDGVYGSEISLAIYLSLRAATLRAGYNRKTDPIRVLKYEIEALDGLSNGTSVDPIFDELQRALDARDSGNEKEGWEIVESTLKNKKRLISESQRRKASAKRLEKPIDELIKRIVRRIPDMTWRDLLNELERQVGNGVIISITDGLIISVGLKNDKDEVLSVSSLSNKLRDARKALKN